MAPLICPVLASTFNPFGRFSTEKVIGRSPVAGMVYKNWEFGRTPKILAPLIRGVAEALGVRIYFFNVSNGDETSLNFGVVIDKSS